MEWNDVNNFMDLECALHKKCNQSPMVVAQRLKFEHDETFSGCLWGLTEVIPDTE